MLCLEEFDDGVPPTELVLYTVLCMVLCMVWCMQRMQLGRMQEEQRASVRAIRYNLRIVTDIATIGPRTLATAAA